MKAKSWKKWLVRVLVVGMLADSVPVTPVLAVEDAAAPETVCETAWEAPTGEMPEEVREALAQMEQEAAQTAQNQSSAAGLDAAEGTADEAAAESAQEASAEEQDAAQAENAAAAQEADTVQAEDVAQSEEAAVQAAAESGEMTQEADVARAEEAAAGQEADAVQTEDAASGQSAAAQEDAQGSLKGEVYLDGSELSEDDAIVLKPGETITGLKTTAENIYNNEWKDGYLYLLDIQETGDYMLETTVYSSMCIRKGETLSSSSLYFSASGSKKLRFSFGSSEKYYFYVKGDASQGDDTFGVSLTKVSTVTMIEAIDKEPTTLYREMLNGNTLQISDFISGVRVTLEDGTTEEVPCFSTEWNDDYQLRYTLQYADGPDVGYENYFYPPAGDYRWLIWCNLGFSRYCRGGAFSVKNISEVEAQTIQVGETVSGLQGVQFYTSDTPRDGYWLKARLKKGTYVLRSLEGIYTYLYQDCEGTENDASLGWRSGMRTIQVQEEADCFFYVRGGISQGETYGVTLEELKELKAVTAEVKKDTYYYGIDGNPTVARVVKAIRLEMKDGSTLSVADGSEAAKMYQVQSSLRQKDGTSPKFVNGSYPIGEYKIMITTYDPEISCEVPVVIADRTEMKPWELGTKKEVQASVSEIFKADLKEGLYSIEPEFHSEGQYCYTYMDFLNESMVKVSNIYLNSYQTKGYFSVTADGTYYLKSRIGYSDYDYALTLKKVVVNDLKLEKVNSSNILLQGVTNYFSPYFSYTDENGEKCVFPSGDSLYSTLKMSFKVYDAETNEEIEKTSQGANYVYLPKVGDYKVVIQSEALNLTKEETIRYGTAEDLDEHLLDQKYTIKAGDTDYHYYKLTVAKADSYQFQGSSEGMGLLYITKPDGTWVGNGGLNKNYDGCVYLEAGTYLIRTNAYYNIKEDVEYTMSIMPKLASLVYSGETQVFEYGEWGYKTPYSGSSNSVIYYNYPSTKAILPNTEWETAWNYSGNNYMRMSFKVDGTQEGGKTLEMYNGNKYWNAYHIKFTILGSDGKAARTDKNGYLANGDYFIKCFAPSGVSVNVPLKVQGGPIELASLSYQGSVQEFKYGEWGYKVTDNLSGSNVLRTSPMGANRNLNASVSGNNIMTMNMSLTGTGTDRAEQTIAYKGKLWNAYKIKTYFYTSDKKEAYTDKDGYLPVGNYFMHCVAEGGVSCEVPFMVYSDKQTETEKELETAVAKVVEASEGLSEVKETASAAEKKAAVQEVLDKVEEVYQNQDITELGEASAEKSIELAEQLAVVEQQIGDLLNTSVTVVPEDNTAKQVQPKVLNALLSVPAGESAKVQITSSNVPQTLAVDQKSAVALKMELKSEKNETLELNAPVLVTVKIPANISKNREIVVYHFHEDNDKLTETIKVKVNSKDGTISFVTGSFSTFVIANLPEVITRYVSGLVKSSGSEDADVNLTLITKKEVTTAEGLKVAAGGQVLTKKITGTASDYTLENVPVGDYKLQVSKEGHVTRTYDVTVNAGSMTVNWDEALICLKGDVNMDGKVDIGDHQYLFTYLQGTCSITDDYQLTIADVNGSSKIDIGDHQRLFTHLQGTDLLK